MAHTTPLSEETVKKVIRQVEFYFSDSNLPKDGFLMKTISESEDGMVGLALISSFSRMRGHLGLGDVKQEDISEDTLNAVAETLRTSTFLKISEDGKKVGRLTELVKPEEVIKQLDVRTVAASPLEFEVKLENVESFFGQYAKVNSVRLPRHAADNRLFSGTALIEFSSEEEAANILNQSLVYSGVELELKPKKEYDVERAKLEEVASQPQPCSNRKDKFNDEPDYPKGLIVAFSLKKISAEDSFEQSGNHRSKNNDADAPNKGSEKDLSARHIEATEQEISADVKDVGQDEGKDVDTNCTQTETREIKDCESSGSLDKKENKGPVEEKMPISSGVDSIDISREDIKAVFQTFGIIKFIDFHIGLVSGYVRFEEAEGAQKARAAAALAEEGGLVVKNCIATLDSVTGDTEKEYWDALRSGRDNFKNNRGRGGRHHKGGRHFGGRNSRNREDSGKRPNKFQKVRA